MGNRAIITTPDNRVGIYVHWNGGIESVLGFTNAAKVLGVRSPESDPSYFLARLGQIIGNFFGGTTSVGFVSDDEFGIGDDNGVWVVHGFDDVRQNSGRYCREFLPDHLADTTQSIIDEIVAKQQPIFASDGYRTTYTTSASVAKEN